jgi:hypothetical protein
VATTEDRAEPQPKAAPAPRPAAPGLAQLVTILGTIVAPTTLLTSLLFYFGWSHAFWFFDYFGVNSTLLDLTNQDYIQRSIDGLFVPGTVTACAGLAGLWGHTLLRARLAAGFDPRSLRVLMAVLAGVGLLLAIGGVASVLTRTRTWLEEYVAAAPVSLAAGVLLLVYVVHLWRARAAAKGAASAHWPPWAAAAEWAAVFVLVGLSLFWAANDYSAAVGRSRARDVVRELPTQPQVVLYSAQSLGLHAPGVREVACQGQEALYRFRYEGLKLILQSGDQYVLVPETWSRADGVTFVMPRNDSLRLEFLPAGVREPVQRSDC